jgi:hypothetical protein
LAFGVVAAILAALVSGCGNRTASSTEPLLSPPDNPAPIQLSPEAIVPQESSPPSQNPSVRVVVTEGFGEKVLLDETVPLAGETTALAALQSVASVETTYGGGFVNAIGGISSTYSGQHREKRDWFFYINGISLSSGAGSYIMQSGDTEYWVYRDWSFRQFIPAVVADFPEPFRHGCRGVIYPTTVAYETGYEEEAALIAGRLGELGVNDAAVSEVAGLSPEDRASRNLILVGTSQCPPIAEMNERWNRLGFYHHFTGEGLAVFDAAGNPAGTYGPGVGVIAATQSPWNPKGVGVGENVVWMFTGVDEAGVRAAAEAFVEDGDALRYACAVLVDGTEVLRLPR